MSFQFPNNPSVGDKVINPTSSIVYTWVGDRWSSQPTTSSIAATALQVVSSPIFTNGDTRFAWSTMFHGNPTGSNGVLSGSAVFTTTNNFDGVRLTTNVNNQRGLCYWSSSRISVENGPVWMSFGTKAAGTADGIFVYINADAPVSGSSVNDSSGLTIFLDEFNGGTTDAVKIYNSSSLVRTISTPGDLEGDDFCYWDVLYFKSGSNYYANIWLSRTLDNQAGPRYMFEPTLLPVSNTTGSAQSLINLGTVFPQGGFFGVIGFTAGLNAFHFFNHLEIRSGYLLPESYNSYLNAGNLQFGGFSKGY
jgi:hypothetical protein